MFVRRYATLIPRRNRHGGFKPAATLCAVAMRRTICVASEAAQPPPFRGQPQDSIANPVRRRREKNPRALLTGRTLRPYHRQTSCLSSGGDRCGHETRPDHRRRAPRSCKSCGNVARPRARDRRGPLRRGHGPEMASVQKLLERLEAKGGVRRDRRRGPIVFVPW